MPKVLITAHRGMGITAKRRDRLIKGAQFFPENSMAAFKEAVSLNADAIECDIHVSLDNIAMVIHGDKIRDYGYEIDAKHKIISVPTDKNRIGNNTFSTLKNKFRLKTWADSEQTLIDLNAQKVIAHQNRDHHTLDSLNNQISEQWDIYNTITEDFNTIPTLEQLLQFTALNNEQREKMQILTLKLNLELKGANAGPITLATIIQHNKKAKDSNNQYPAINPDDIILLGRRSVGEIISAKSLLIGAAHFLEKTKDMNQKSFKKERHVLLKALIGTNEQIDIYGSESAIPQIITHSKISATMIKKYSEDNRKIKGSTEINILRDFLAEVSQLSAIRTNVMLSTGDLYGSDSLVPGDEDFDLKEGVMEISESGKALIQNCLLNHQYDGIDISLFDFENETCRAISECTDRLKATDQHRVSIVGATASNWKGVKQEASPISPAEAILKAHYIAQTLGIDIILKVDEPGFFKTLYQGILDQTFYRRELEIVQTLSIPDDRLATLTANNDLFRTESNVIEIIQFTGSSQQIFDSLDKHNYDLSISSDIAYLDNSAKPPRKERKKSATNLFSPPSTHSAPELITTPIERAYSLDSQRFSLSNDLDTDPPFLSPRSVSLRKNSIPFSPFHLDISDELSDLADERSPLIFSFNKRLSELNVDQNVFDMDDEKDLDMVATPISVEPNIRIEKKSVKQKIFSSLFNFR